MSKDGALGSPPVDEEILPFELIVGDPGGEILNGDVAVRWCVTPALVEHLEASEIVDPHVLLVSANKGCEMQRQMVPITELMTYVRFTKAGDNDLFGFIVGAGKGRKKLHSTYFRKTNGDYETDIMFSYTNLPHDNLPNEYCRTSVTINIPAGVFGKEPGPWMKWYVNEWHNRNGKVIDECHYKHRFIVAFTLKVIPFLIWTMMLIAVRFAVSSLLMLSGYWKDNHILRSFRPFKYPGIDHNIIGDVELYENQLIFHWKHSYTDRWNGKKEVDYVPLFVTIPLFPSILLVSASGAYTTEYFGETFFTMTAILLTLGILFDIGHAIKRWIETTPFFQILFDALEKRLGVAGGFITATSNMFHSGVLLTAAGAAIFLVFSALYLLFQVSNTFMVAFGTIVAAGFCVVLLFKFSEPVLVWIDNFYSIAPENNNYGEIKELLCPKDEDNLRPRYDYIPPKQRTVRLWYLDMKNKICKPMQS